MALHHIRSRAHNISQLSLPLSFKREKDKNFHLGGKSFYFFDFDDNIAYLTTPIFLFNKENEVPIQISSKQFARHHNSIGKIGKFKDFHINYDDELGSFKNFRDQKFTTIEKIQKKKQSFVSDLESIMQKNCESWKAPSWNRFLHATYNQRPMSVITARGHSPETIENGISALVKEGHLPCNPNYLSIYPVSHPNIRQDLKSKNGINSEQFSSVADLKKMAIRESFYKALKLYGNDKPHRFGMSDDDPKNIDIIIDEMQSLKSKHPLMSFFVIRTFKSLYIKDEILESSTRTIINKAQSASGQLNLF